MSAAGEMFLSRARLRRDAPASALRALLSRDGATRTAGAHRLVWTLFSDNADRQRDFLWREAEPSTFYLLSARLPEDRHGLFRVDPPKLFAPTLLPGDRLRFVLRVNATVARKSEGRPVASGRVRGGRCDVVMDAVHAIPRDERPEMRSKLLAPVAAGWLAVQGEKHGFTLGERERWEAWEASDCDGTAEAALEVNEYRVVQLDRGPRVPRMEFGVLDLKGTLVVRDPEAFISALGRGFGRAKAFGCGLMLIRRATGPR